MSNARKEGSLLNIQATWFLFLLPIASSAHMYTHICMYEHGFYLRVFNMVRIAQCMYSLKLSSAAVS